jgi:PREDICTED: nuclear factor NF-kappa-B p105 subunit-like
MGKGKMGGALSAWLKEFCALVFIQSIQAFTFAIIMVMVINLVKGESANSKAAPLGMVAVVAMASISKLEDLVKKMFGIGPSVTDPSLRGGMKSWATGMVAFGAAKRVADNGKKFFGGIGSAAAASKAKKSALQRKQKFLDDYAKAHGAIGAGSGGAGGGVGGSAGATGGASAGGAAGNVSYNDYMKYRDRLEAYNDKINEAKKNQRAAFKDMGKGILETGGAIAGAASGAAFSAATGDADTIIKSAITGAGVGDILGEKVIDIPVSVSTTIKDVSGGAGKSAIKKEIKQKKAQVDKYFEDNGFDVSDTQ